MGRDNIGAILGHPSFHAIVGIHHEGMTIVCVGILLTTIYRIMNGTARGGRGNDSVSRTARTIESDGWRQQVKGMGIVVKILTFLRKCLRTSSAYYNSSHHTEFGKCNSA